MAANTVNKIPLPLPIQIPLPLAPLCDKKVAQPSSVVDTKSVDVESKFDINVKPEFCKCPCSHCNANSNHVQWKGLDSKQIPIDGNDLRSEKSIPKEYLAVLDDQGASKMTAINWDHDGFAIHDYGNGREFQGFRRARLNHINPGYMLNHGVQDGELRFINFDDLIPKELVKRVCIAGGAVLNNMVACGFGDIDFYPIGTPEENEKTVRQLLHYWNYRCVGGSFNRTERSISFIGSNGEKNSGFTTSLQIILINNKSIDEVVSNFDIDCVKVAYYNGSYYWNKFSEYSIKTGSNVVIDIGVSDDSFAHRLIKYGKRGFRVLIPDYIPRIEDQITAIKCYKKYKMVSGLTELLVAHYDQSYKRGHDDERGSACYDRKVHILEDKDGNNVIVDCEKGMRLLARVEEGKQVSLFGYSTDRIEYVFNPPCELHEVADRCEVTRMVPFKLLDDLSHTKRPFTWPEFIYRMVY